MKKSSILVTRYLDYLGESGDSCPTFSGVGELREAVLGRSVRLQETGDLQRRNEIRQADLTGHAGGHARLSEKR